MIGTIYGVAKEAATSGFLSGLFKKPSSPDGVQHLRDLMAGRCPPTPAWDPSKARSQGIFKFVAGQPMTTKEARECREDVRGTSINWTKAQKANLETALASIQTIPDPPPPSPPEIHKVSSSYSPQAQTQTIEKSRDITEVVQADLFKIPATLKTPLFILVGGIAILSIFKLGKGGIR